MADYGQKVSKSGFDVKTADDKDLIFTSKFSALKILAEGKLTLNYVANSGSVSGTVAHSQSYIPGFMVFGEVSNTSGRWYQSNHPDYLEESSPEGVTEFYSWTDANNLNIKIEISSGHSWYATSRSFDTYYYILVEQAS